jgi:pantoate--beta-alanine ligase
VRETRTIADARAALARVPPGSTVGLVPTMGALHRGHLELLRTARNECDVVAASIFVNPTQFDRADDLARYPRDEDADLRTLAGAGVEVAFLPTADELYPEGFQTWVDVGDVAKGLEGDARPGHFRAVATVCLKLFNIVRPDRAYFGQKDAQQTEVVARMIRDLDLPIELRVVPTVRDPDGVALSSRNALLSDEEREAARALPRALFAGEAAHRDGADALAAARRALLEEPRLETEYVDAVRWNGRLLLTAAARAGDTRLIDNVVLEGGKS